MSKTIYDELEQLTVESFGGVDALTVTATGLEGKLAIASVLEAYVEDLAVQRRTPFFTRGARGWTTGNIAYADKAQNGQRLWAILRVVGGNSHRALNAVSHYAVRASRIDFRMDVRLSRSYPNLAEHLYKTRPGGRFIESLTGQTVYPENDRKHSYYGRVYDKSSEYGETLGTVWRWEVEIKRGAAQQYAVGMLNSDSPAEFIQDSVFGIFSERWLYPTPKSASTPTLNSLATTIISTDSKLAWLRQTVKPTVRYLCAMGLEQEVTESLGLWPKAADEWELSPELDKYASLT